MTPIRTLSLSLLVGGLLFGGSAPLSAHPHLPSPAEFPVSSLLPALQLECAAPRGDASERASPYDSVSATVGSTEIKICYGRPSARGRTMVGSELHPFGEPWRLGANEATVIHLSGPAVIGDIPVSAGSYSLYAVPGADRWEIVVNGTPERWGIPITPEVRATDLGVTAVPVESGSHVETFTIRTEADGSDALRLIFEWEEWRVSVPVRAAAD